MVYIIVLYGIHYKRVSCAVYISLIWYTLKNSDLMWYTLLVLYGIHYKKQVLYVLVHYCIRLLYDIRYKGGQRRCPGRGVKCYPLPLSQE